MGCAVRLKSVAGGTVLTAVVAVAELFAALGSVIAEVTVAVLLTDGTEAAVVVVTMLIVAVAPLFSMPASVQFTVPVAPTAGVVHTAPAGATMDAKFTVAGSVSLTMMAVAGDGPLLVTTMV